MVEGVVTSEIAGLPRPLAARRPLPVPPTPRSHSRSLPEAYADELAARMAKTKLGV